MNKLIRFATPLMAVAIMSSVHSIALAQNSQTGNQLQVNATQDSNSLPQGTEQAQQGFRDGIEAARSCAGRLQPSDATVSHLYVHPPVKGDAAVTEYRAAFQTGYDAAVKHRIEVRHVNQAGVGI